MITGLRRPEDKARVAQNPDKGGQLAQVRAIARELREQGLLLRRLIRGL
jgi:hypothetical protein